MSTFKPRGPLYWCLMLHHRVHLSVFHKGLDYLSCSKILSLNSPGLSRLWRKIIDINENPYSFHHAYRLRVFVVLMSLFILIGSRSLWQIVVKHHPLDKHELHLRYQGDITNQHSRRLHLSRNPKSKRRPRINISNHIVVSLPSS